MNDYARHLVASAACLILPTKGQRLRARLARQLLPYCLVHLGDRALLLNRNYKPLGWPDGRRDRVDYLDPSFASMAIGIPAVPACAWQTNPDGQTFLYLYGGPRGRAPWNSAQAAQDYLRRLEQILGGRISEEGVL